MQNNKNNTQQQQMPTVANACVKGFRDPCNSNLSKRKDNFITHNFWSEIAQILGKDYSF